MMPQFADKAYLINLGRRVDRWYDSAEQFARHGLQVERFPAIDGNDIRRGYASDRANAGCTLSHFSIIQRAQLMGLDTVMVFEDDVVLHDDFREILTAAMKALPSYWAMLYFGGSHRDPAEPFNDHLMRVRRTLTTHGYILRKTVFADVLRDFSDASEPVDCLFAEIQTYRTCFVTNPPIAWQRAGHSDIQGRHMDYPWLQTNDQ